MRVFYVFIRRLRNNFRSVKSTFSCSSASAASALCDFVWCGGVVLGAALSGAEEETTRGFSVREKSAMKHGDGEGRFRRIAKAYIKCMK